MGRLADQLFGRAFVDDEEEYQRQIAEGASQREVAPPSPDVAMTLPGSDGPSAPQGTMPTAQEQDVPVGPQPWQQTATDIAESAPGRFVRAAAEAVPKTLENVGTVAGMMVGAPLIAQGAKAIPGIAATALQVARNPMAALRERPMAGPAAALAAEVAMATHQEIEESSHDFLDFEKKEQNKQQHRVRMLVHMCFALVLLLMIIIFKETNKDAIINFLFKVAGITYGPLLGLFSFGVLTHYKVRDRWVLPVCLLAPLLTWIIDNNSSDWFNGFQFGFLSLALNGLLTFAGLWFIRITTSARPM